MSKFSAAAQNREGAKSESSSFKKVIGSVFAVLYRLRKVVMALPVIYYTIRLAAYNESHLPSEVGLFLQNNGNFLRMVDRGTAVFWPMVLTFACLLMMVFSRKAMYAWAISIFSLALPLLILVSNIYPA